MVPRASGALVIAGDNGFSFLDPGTGEFTPITDPESSRPENRFNDGKCDPAGRFRAGTMHLSKPRQPVGALYRLDADHSVAREPQAGSGRSFEDHHQLVEAEQAVLVERTPSTRG